MKRVLVILSVLILLNYLFILYFTVKPNVYQNLIKLVFSLI